MNINHIKTTSATSPGEQAIKELSQAIARRTDKIIYDRVSIYSS